MKKTKKIIISLCISLVILLVIYFISNFKSNSDYIKLPVFKSNLLEDTTITKNDITYISVKDYSLNEEFKSKIADIKNIENMKINRNVYAGEFVLKTTIENKKEGLNKTYKYVSLPISSDSLGICNNVKFSDKVDVCYTAKLKDVSYAIKDKKRIYSNNLPDGYVTCILFEDVEVVSKTDSTGRDNNSNVITNIIVRLPESEAMLVSNLKNLGTMDIITK